MIHQTITLLDPAPQRRRPLFRGADEYNTDLGAQASDHSETLWQEITAYAEYKRIISAPLRDSETIERLCKIYTFLTGANMMIADMDHRFRVTEIKGHRVDYRRLELDDWYKSHILGKETPTWRIIALHKNPNAGIAENRMILHGLLALSPRTPTFYCLYSGFRTILTELYRLDIHTKPVGEKKRSASCRSRKKRTENMKPTSDNKRSCTSPPTDAPPQRKES